MKLKPLGTNVLVEKLGSEEKTVSGIIIPKEKENSNNIGVVVVVGEGRMVDELWKNHQQKREIKLYILGVRRLSLKVRNMTLFLKAVY